MKLHALGSCAAVLFALISPAFGSQKEAARPVSELADEQAEAIDDATEFVAELNDAVGMAQEGEYGQLKRTQMQKLLRARDNIVKLLDGHTTATELSAQERLDLYNQQETFRAILRNDDKNRVVCTREIRLGSRVPTTECLTVADREERARAARYSIDETTREVCHPGEGSNCG